MEDRTQRKVLLVGVVAASILCGCESAPKVQRVDVAPANCEFLATIYIDQLGDQPAGDEAVKDLKRQAAERGGDTLQCCEMEPEETILCGVNRRGGATYAGSHRHVGRVYRCLGEFDGVVAPGTREALRASIGPGYEHVAKIEGPKRYLAQSERAISVVGSLSDPDLHTILDLVGERVAEATSVTGDNQFAVVQLGDPEHDPCCTTTILFENWEGVWTNMGAIMRSH